MKASGYCPNSDGVSNEWIARVCKALRVPVPGPGYWAKKSAGKLVAKRPPLPLGFICAGNYVFAVLTTHGAKVLVHILFSNLAIMEAQQR